MTTPETAVDRIPIGRSVNYAVRGVPEIGDEYNAERTITPTEITLVYRAAPDPQLGRVSAYVKGWWMQDGKRVPMDKPVGRWLYGDPECWPAWLAEEARLHDPDAPAAGQAPATDQTAPAVWVDGHPQLEAIAAAVWEQCRTEDTSLVVDDPRNIAVAALAAVLPASVDRADVLDQAAAIVFALDFDELRATTQFDSHRQAWELGTIDAANKLRRVAAETPGTTKGVCSNCKGSGLDPRYSAGDSACPDCPAGGARQPSQADTDRVVAYRMPVSNNLYCVLCCGADNDRATPLTPEDLPDGGLCVCGADVLIPQQPKEA